MAAAKRRSRFPISPALLRLPHPWPQRVGPKEPAWREGVETVFVANVGAFHATNVARVSLPDGTALTRPTKEDRKRIRRLQERALFSLTAWSTPTLEEHVAKTRIKHGDYESAEEEARRRLHRVRSVLRLMKPGPVSLSGTLAYQPGVRFSERRPSLWLPGGPLFSAARLDYEFERGDKAILRQLYDKLANVPEQARLALRRFEGAYEREAVQDRLVDHWVALESLFSKGREPELRYKFAMRIAYFLERAPQRRLTLFRGLYDAYQVRSDILHGTVSKKDMMKAEEVSADALRRSLRSVVMEGDPPDADQLDDLAAQGMPRRGPP